MEIAKECGPRKSKKHPNAYTVEELKEIAKAKKEELGMTISQINKLSKDELCHVLFQTELKQVEIPDNVERECGPRKSSKHPYAYDLKELRTLATLRKDELKLTETQINVLNKNELCNILFDTGLEVKRSNLVEFNGKCDDYSMNTLKAIAKKMELPGTGKREELCKMITMEYKGSKFFKKVNDFVRRIYNLEQDVNKIHLHLINEEIEKDLEGELSNEDKKMIKNDYNVIIKRLEYELQDQVAENIVKNLYEEKEDEEVKIAENSCLKPFNPEIHLREHQKRVVNHLLTHRGLVAIHGTGTGKTLTCIAAMNCVLQNFPDVKIIFIAPVSLLANFRKELIKFGFDVDSDLIKNKVQIYSYQGFYNKYKNKKEVTDCNRKFLIIDEAHNLKAKITNKDNRSKKILNCAQHAFKVLLLTATPMKNRPEEIINLISMVDGVSPNLVVKKKNFNNYILEDEQAFMKYFGCKISMNMLPKDENYPRRIEVPISQTSFIMTDDYYKKYYNIQEVVEKQFVNLIFNNNNPESLKLFYNGVRRASLSLENANSPKMKWTIDKIVEETNAGRKLIVYSSWIGEGLNVLAKALEERKIGYGMIIGSIKADEREKTKLAFNEGKIKVLLLSKAGGEGLDLKNCHSVILTEPNWNTNDDEQIIGRAIRYKSHAELPESERYVKIYRLILKKPDKLIPEDDQEFSVDDILYQLGHATKAPVIDDMLARLDAYSIEKMDCGTYFGNKDFKDFVVDNKKIKEYSGMDDDLDDFIVDDDEEEEERSRKKKKNKKDKKSKKEKKKSRSKSPKKKTTYKPKKKKINIDDDEDDYLYQV